MTTINGPILFNAVSGGSDTGASGVGPSTPVNGTGASSTASSATVDLSADTPDLSGVSAGDLFWIDSSSGRQFSVIASVDDGADTVTCDDTFANTESGRNWGIGGKRATLDNSRTLLDTDIKAGHIVEIEDDESFSSEIAWNLHGSQSAGPVWVRGATGGKPTLTVTGASQAVFNIDDPNGGSRSRISNLTLTSTHASPGDGLETRGNQMIDVIDVEITGCNDGWHRYGNNPNATFINCHIHDNDGHGVFGGNSALQLSLIGCTINNNGGAGVTSHGMWTVMFCKIYENTSYGCSLNESTCHHRIVNNTIHDNGDDGISLGNIDNEISAILNNNITGNTGYGIDNISSSSYDHAWIDYNNFGTGGTANSSGDYYTSFSHSIGDNNINVDPGYGDAANGDFSVGANVKGLAFPGAHADGADTGYLDIGAVQRQEPGNQAKLRRVMHIGEGVLL